MVLKAECALKNTYNKPKSYQDFIKSGVGEFKNPPTSVPQPDIPQNQLHIFNSIEVFMKS